MTPDYHFEQYIGPDQCFVLPTWKFCIDRLRVEAINRIQSIKVSRDEYDAGNLDVLCARVQRVRAGSCHLGAESARRCSGGRGIRSGGSNQRAS
jgi:hypothetical protein